MGNTQNLKHKVLKDLYTFVCQSTYFKNINLKKIKNSSPYAKMKCLILSKNLSKYIKENNIKEISNSTLIPLVVNNTSKLNFKLYKKHFELIKLYTIMFTEKSCSHLAFYLYNNINESNINENKENLSIVIEKNSKYTLILRDNLDIFVKKHCKKQKGEVFTEKMKKNVFLGIKHQLYLCFFSVIVVYLLIYNIPNNYIIMEMNLTMHMKMNHNGHVLSYKPKSKSARVMINETKKLKGKIDHTIPTFINYGLENKIIKPGENVKIYIIGPPLNKKLFEKLKCSLANTPLNIIINNSGNLIKINST